MNAPRNPAGWFEIYVQDMDRAKEFYQQNKFSIGRYGFISLVLDTEGNRIGLHSMM